MKRTALLGLVGLIALGTIGCTTNRIASHSASFRAPPRVPTYAIAVTVHGGLQPTAAQWAAIQAKVADDLAWRGAMLVTDIALADRIIRVDFRPNPLNPETSGHLTILGVRNNPYRGVAMANTGPFSPAFSYNRAFSHSSFWGSNNYYSGDYFNYVGPWENGYTSGSTTVTTVNPKPVNPPHRHRPGDRELCPPDALPRNTPTYASTATPRFAVNDTAGFANTSPSPTNEPSRARWTGARSAWGSDPASSPSSDRVYARNSSGGGSRSERAYAYNDSSVSRSSSSWWRGSDSSSYRDSSYQSSSYSGSSYSSSSSSSSGPRFSSADAGVTHSSPSYSSPSPSFASEASAPSSSPSPSPSSSSSSDSGSSQNAN